MNVKLLTYEYSKFFETSLEILLFYNTLIFFEIYDEKDIQKIFLLS